LSTIERRLVGATAYLLVRGSFSGADDGIRTSDPHLGKVAQARTVPVRETEKPLLRGHTGISRYLSVLFLLRHVCGTRRGRMDIREARSAVNALYTQVAGISGRDSEQDIRGMALPVLDAVVRAARDFVHLDDPVLDAIEDVISPEAVARGGTHPGHRCSARAMAIEVGLDRAIKAEGGDQPLTMRPEPGPFDT